MPLVMLKPDWPDTFKRRVRVGRKERVIHFEAQRPVDLTDAEYKVVRPDIGKAIFDVELDDKDRPRFVEPVDDTREQLELEPASDGENLSG